METETVNVRMYEHWSDEVMGVAVGRGLTDVEEV